jgi:prepilin-type N-terminal cleavage/methylation domain-containing protein
MALSPAPRSNARARGFSFIEILVVMGIIAVLAGLGTMVVMMWIKGAPKKETEATAQLLTGQVNAWKGRHHAYPPAKLADVFKVAGEVGAPIKHTSNGENEGIEALFQALNWPSVGADTGLSAEKQLSNLDEDKLSNSPTAKGPDLFEIKDGWGNPFVYFPNTAYAQADRDPPTYSSRNGPVNPRPWKEEGGGFVNPNGFQVFSMGEDGEPNTEDDVKGW